MVWIPATQCDILTLMKHRILKKKLMLLHHIENLDKSSYACQIYDVQKRLFLPGLISECQPFLTKLDGPEPSLFIKLQWKKLVNKNILKFKKLELLDKMTTFKKLNGNELVNEKLLLFTIFLYLNHVYWHGDQAVSGELFSYFWYDSLSIFIHISFEIK